MAYKKMQENLFPLKISIFYDFVKPSACAESEQPLNEQKKKKRKREKDLQPFWLQINPQMWAECNWCCAGFLPLCQPETKAWTCTKSAALVKTPAALSGMLSDNPEPATITVSPYREKCELKRSQSPLAEESLQGREGKGKKEAGIGVWRTSPSPFLPGSLGSLSVEGVSCMVIPGHWRGPRAKKYYSVGALLLSFLLLPISLTAAGHGYTSKVRTKTDIYRITCRKGSEDDLDVHLGTQTDGPPHSLLLRTNMLGAD